MNRIYLDHAATSPLFPAARESMERWLDSGNPSTLYEEGRLARRAIDESRETLANALGCEFAELIFTSGGTESAALAIIGAALAALGGNRRRILISAAEHHCVLNTREHLGALGFEVEPVPVDRFARPQLDSVADDVLLVCAMHANNEIGSITDVASIAEIARRHGALVFSDCVQSFGKFGWRAGGLGVDLASVSAHKIGGPKGAGALFVKAGTKLKPLHAGGGQERELRAGTENVAAIAGFAAAVRACGWDDVTVAKARDRLLEGLRELGAVPTLASEIPTLSGHAHVRFPGVSAETLLIRLDREGVSAGSGAACSSGSIEPSHVLAACGYSASECREGIRFTLGAQTTLCEVEEAIARVATVLRAVRG